MAGGLHGLHRWLPALHRRPAGTRLGRCPLIPGPDGPREGLAVASRPAPPPDPPRHSPLSLLPLLLRVSSHGGGPVGRAPTWLMAYRLLAHQAPRKCLLRLAESNGPRQIYGCLPGQAGVCPQDLSHRLGKPGARIEPSGRKGATAPLRCHLGAQASSAVRLDLPEDGCLGSPRSKSTDQLVSTDWGRGRTDLETNSKW